MALRRRSNSTAVKTANRYSSAEVTETESLSLNEAKEECTSSDYSSTLDDKQCFDGISSDSLQYFSWISSLAPCFTVSGNQIAVLSEPTVFYETLKELAKNAKHRIVLASLYLGTGQLEQELVDCIHDAITRCRDEDRSDLRVSILLDYMRGSRGKENSRTMLLPLIKDFRSSVTVALYHTPMLRGVFKELLPERFNEIVGLNHIKAYIFDDTVVISGANLSESYFTNRQDRYMVLSDCRPVADFFDRLITCVQKFSFHVQQDDTVGLAEGSNFHPFAEKDGGSRYRAEMSRCIKDVIRPLPVSSSASSESSVADTVIYPLVQMGPFDVRVDECVTSRLFETPSPDVTMFLASGYLNLVDKYRHSLIHQCRSAVQILTAAPEANGFFGAKGVSSAIPDAYTYIAREFYEEVSSSNQQHRVTLHEFSRQDWTVHAKGLWYSLPHQTLPSMTMIGSPNFGYRSVYRDLEAQMIIVTKNRKLRERLHQERVQLFARSKQVCEKTFLARRRQIPRWVTFVTPLIRNFF